MSVASLAAVRGACGFMMFVMVASRVDRSRVGPAWSMSRSSTPSPARWFPKARSRALVFRQE